MILLILYGRSHIIRIIQAEYPVGALGWCKFILAYATSQTFGKYLELIAKEDIFYLVRKYTHSTDFAYKAVGKLLEIVKVCSVTNNDILIAFQKKAKDFEDCLVATCAKSIHCD